MYFTTWDYLAERDLTVLSILFVYSIKKYVISRLSCV